ncbi:dihydrofolate reductase family protein [Propionibacteriaceae bacterium G1746]|uniref:dihydrofolate reductase family protein n=1 Tax=Aestuariimicrobium sp. G57 TaxID=3418485 RepID=UPI003C245123
MRQLTYSMGMSLDGYITGPDGTFDWADPDPEVFQLSLDELDGIGTHLLGRRIHEAMLYWETAEERQELDAQELEWARRWKQLPKVVFSTTLTTVEGTNTRLATRSLAAEVAALKAEPGTGDIAIAGATLAAQAADLDLIDEYLVRVFPVLVGGGQPFFAHHGHKRELELVENRTVGTVGRVVYLRYRVRRPGGRVPT